MSLNVPGHSELRRIVVLNPKGGAGKTTLAFNIAGYLASTGRPAALMDFDPQGSTTRWLQRRPASLPAIHGIAAYEKKTGVTRSFQLRVPAHIRHVIIDTPAALTTAQLSEFTPGAHAILVPVLPSAIDIHSASQLISNLLLVAKVSRRMGRLGIVANRVREQTVGFRKLMAFLDRLQIPIVAALRDSQNYVHSAEEGCGLHEMLPSRVRKDLMAWLPLTSWLDIRLNTPLTTRDTLGAAPGQPPPAAAPSPAPEPAGERVIDLRTHLARRDAGRG